MDEAVNALMLGGTFQVQCFNKDGSLKWEDHAKNAVTKAGLNDLLNQYFRSGANPTTQDIKDGWVLGILKGSGLSPNDTHSSHPGWTEFTTYKISGNNLTRPEWSPTASTLQKLTASLVDFDVSLGNTISGVFLVGGTVNGVSPSLSDADRKGGTNSTPLLWSHAPFSTGNQIVTSGDVLRVTYIVSASSV